MSPATSPSTFICSKSIYGSASCKNKDVVRKGFVERGSRTVSICLKPFSSCAHIAAACRSSGQTLQGDIKSADEKKYTRTLEKFALILPDSMTIPDVAGHLHKS